MTTQRSGRVDSTLQALGPGSRCRLVRLVHGGYHLADRAGTSRPVPRRLRMTSVFLQLLLDHNAWATRVLLLNAGRLERHELDRRFDIGPGSIHDTLRHIIGAMRRWADRIRGRDVRPSIEDGDRRYELRELRELLDEADADLRAVATAIEARRGWSEVFEFVTSDGGRTYRFTRAAALTHVVTHGIHHRAQLLNIRRQLGLPPLGLDLDVVEWECVQSGQIDHPLARQAAP